MRLPYLPFVLGLGLVASDARADDRCGLEDPAIAEAAGPPPRRAAEARTRARGRFLQRPRGGALAGKTVYVSAGHGWVSTGDGWGTQRGNTHRLVEDFISAETISQHLIPYLWDLGAYVVPVRESSMQTEMVIAGRDVPAVLTGAATPFDGATGVELGAGESLTLAIPAPTRGEYDLYASWVQGPDRASDARWTIRHAGGEAEVRVDQRRHGSTWVLLGRWVFDEASEVVVDNDGDAIVSVDAVRLGGGLGHVDRGAGPSGRPAYEDGARYAAQWNGAPASVWDYTTTDGNDDVGSRSRFAAWDHEDGEDAVYVAWHTNAPSPARGTVSFAYGPEPFGDLSQFSGVPGSLELMDAIHTSLIDAIRAGWDPAWQDRGQRTAYFGEVNPNHNPEMPATLIEVAFHDTLEDAEALRDPRFRAIAARAIAHGIARYFAERDGVPLVLPPATPGAVRAVGGRVAWAAVEGATGYRVYQSADGVAFDDGRDVAEPSAALDAPFARVTAVNAGGESRPSRVVGSAGRGQVLVVAGFTRIDGAMLFAEELPGLGVIDRAYEARINDGSHAARYGRALAARGYGFDVATVDALGAIDLGAYEAIVWAAGEELAAPDLGAMLDGGAAVIVSGTEIARLADPALAARLGIAFVADDAGAYAATGAGPLDGLAIDFGDDGPGGYDADACDVLAPAADGAVVLAYDTGGGAAVIAGRAAVLGFPIETIGDEAARAELLARLLATFEVAPDAPPPHETAPAGCCSGGRGGGAATLALIVLLGLTARTRRSNLRPPWPKPSS